MLKYLLYHSVYCSTFKKNICIGCLSRPNVHTTLKSKTKQMQTYTEGYLPTRKLIQPEQTLGSFLELTSALIRRSSTEHHVTDCKFELRTECTNLRLRVQGQDLILFKISALLIPSYSSISVDHQYGHLFIFLFRVNLSVTGTFRSFELQS